MKKRYGLPGCTDEKGYPRTGLMIRYLTKRRGIKVEGGSEIAKIYFSVYMTLL